MADQFRDHYWDLWEQKAVTSGYSDDLNNARVGPTLDCLSPKEVASFMNDGEIDQKIIEHLNHCETCRIGITRFKTSNTF